MNRWLQRWHNLRRLPLADIWLLIRLGGLLILIRLGLWLLPFPRLRQLLYRLGQPQPAQPTTPMAELARLAWATSKMGRFILADKPCLTQALAVQLLFARRGQPAELRIGVRKQANGRSTPSTPSPLEAHAWVEIDGQVVIGGADSPREFTVLPSIEGKGLL